MVEKKVLEIFYQSSKVGTKRFISPNHIVHADFRYHLRSYCHKDGAYKDFVIGRITEAEIISTETHLDNWHEWRSDENDRDWHQIVELKYTINPELDDSMKKHYHSIIILMIMEYLN